jgi:hypothetical protein
VLPVLLVVGPLSIASGVAVPLRVLPNAPAAIVTDGVSLLNPAVLVGVGLCLGGVAALVLGTLLLSCEELI